VPFDDHVGISSAPFSALDAQHRRRPRRTRANNRDAILKDHVRGFHVYSLDRFVGRSTTLTIPPPEYSIECEPDHSEFLPPAVESPLSRGRKHVPKEGKMDILSATFGGGAAVEIWVGAVVFLLMYLTGFVLFQKWRRISMPTPVVHRHIISGLSAALAAMAVAFWLHAANSATASAKEQAGSAIAPQDLRSPVETKLMPVLRFEDQSVIYPGRN
jgi:hypothetical protein